MGLGHFSGFDRVNFSGRPDGLRERWGKAPGHDIGHFVSFFHPDKCDNFGRLPSGIARLCVGGLRKCARSSAQ
jgi:hypothetical protein